MVLSPKGYPVPLTKRCDACRATRPASDFHRNPSTDDLLRSNCKVCQRAHVHINKADRPGVYANIRRRRRALLSAAEYDGHTDADMLAYWNEQGWAGCYWCDMPIVDDDPLHIDHLVPLALGGAHTLANLVPSHASCNCRKRAMDPWTFAAALYPWLAQPSHVGG